MEQYKKEFIEFMVDSKVLKFGEGIVNLGTGLSKTIPSIKNFILAFNSLFTGASVQPSWKDSLRLRSPFLPDQSAGLYLHPQHRQQTLRDKALIP